MIKLFNRRLCALLIHIRAELRPHVPTTRMHTHAPPAILICGQRETQFLDRLVNFCSALTRRDTCLVKSPANLCRAGAVYDVVRFRIAAFAGFFDVLIGQFEAGIELVKYVNAPIGLLLAKQDNARVRVRDVMPRDRVNAACVRCAARAVAIVNRPEDRAAVWYVFRLLGDIAIVWTIAPLS